MKETKTFFETISIGKYSPQLYFKKKQEHSSVLGGIFTCFILSFFFIALVLILRDAFSMNNFNLKSKGFDLEFKSDIDLPSPACHDCDPVVAMEFLDVLMPLNISVDN